MFEALLKVRDESANFCNLGRVLQKGAESELRLTDGNLPILKMEKYQVFGFCAQLLKIKIKIKTNLLLRFEITISGHRRLAERAIRSFHPVCPLGKKAPIAQIDFQKFFHKI